MRFVFPAVRIGSFAICSLVVSVTSGTELQLPGTGKLTVPKDIVAEQLKQVNSYWLGRIADAQHLRDRNWRADFSSVQAYLKWVAPHRARCRAMLGLPGLGAQIGQPTVELIADGPLCRIERIAIPVADGLCARGLLLLPKTSRPHPAVIVCGDADTWPERFAGIDSKGTPPKWLPELISRGAIVYIPQSIERLQDHPCCKTTNGKDRRWILHRLGYVVGRPMVGLDVQDVIVAIDYLAGRQDVHPKRIGIAGIGQGGMTALYTAALDQRLAASVVVDYFEARDKCWQEPPDRRLPGQLLEFGDAEVAAMIAPRTLAIVCGPDSPMSEARAKGEGRCARRFYEGLKLADRLTVATEVPAQERVARAVEMLAEALSLPGRTLQPPEVRINVPDDRALTTRNEHFDERIRYLRKRIEVSESRRERRWRITGRPASEFKEIQQRMLEDYRRLIGQVPLEALPLNPRTELALITDKYKAYRVLLDVTGGVQVYGNLLIPRDVQGRVPAVICQHGLSGRPEMITGLNRYDDNPYHEFGRHLAERGYVVFSPLLMHQYPVRQIDDQVRMADLVGAMRIAVPVAKTNRVIDFLQTLPFVDPQRIGYYGLSYGGYSAIWMAPPLDRLAAVVISGHFNDWRSKITSEKEAASYLQHPDEDFYNWDILHRFTHPELIAMAAPRPVCIEFGERDGITTPQWTDYAWRQVVAIRDHLGLEDRIRLAHYDGVHEVHGVETFDFLDRFLWPERTVGRDYEYTMLGDQVNALTQITTTPYVKHSLDANANSWITGRFWLPTGAREFRGMAVKLTAVGRPGLIEARFGTAPGRDDLGAAKLDPNGIVPLFEQWYELRVPPQAARSASFIHFELRVASGGSSPVGEGSQTGGGHLARRAGGTPALQKTAPAECYQVFGPRPIGGKDYPRRFGLAYRVLTDRPQDALDVPGKQHPFAHVRAMTGPYYSEDPALRLRGRVAQSDETTVANGWTIEFVPDADTVIQTAATDLQAFFKCCAGVDTELSTWSEAARAKTITLTALGRPSLRSGIHGDEDYDVDVRADRIAVQAITPRGVMRGVYWLEDMMRFRGGPYLKRGEITRHCWFDRRITCSIVPGGTKYTELARPLLYTDGLLQRISHQGFSAIWVWTSFEEVALESRTFPELDNPAARQSFARFNDVCRRAKRFGLDVYGYLSWCEDFRIPDSFYAKHPEAKGTAWNNSMCPSDPQVRAYYTEIISGLFRHVPGLKGLIGIFDSEGMYHCGTYESLRKKCPRCRNRTPEDISLELIRTLRNAITAGGGPEKEWIVWPYGGAESEPWVVKVIERLPKDVLFQADFSKGAMTEKDGIKHMTGDYNISTIGPPATFVREYDVARKAGLKVMAKTEHAVSQEFITVPYIPCMQQWHDRMAAMLKYDLAGMLANWCHYGYTPSRPAEIMMWYSWTPAPPIDELLTNMARRDFGEAAAPHVVSAWDHFSRGIRHYPYSDPVARYPGPIQKGPSQPLFLHTDKVGLPCRSWQNDLKWTKPWGPQITAKHFRLLQEEFDAGIAELQAAREGIADGAKRRELDKELGLARIIRASVHTILNLIEWIPVRDAYAKASPGPERDKLREQLVKIGRDELANARAAVPIVEADSRIGASSEGGGMAPGGLFSPALIRYKIAMLEDALDRQLMRIPGGT